MSSMFGDLYFLAEDLICDPDGLARKTYSANKHGASAQDMCGHSRPNRDTMVRGPGMDSVNP